jgi:hypothetical protein
MTDSGEALAKFFRELAKNRRQYNDYLRDPLTVMREAGLDEDVIGLVLAGDLSTLNELLETASVICGTVVHG